MVCGPQLALLGALALEALPLALASLRHAVLALSLLCHVESPLLCWLLVDRSRRNQTAGFAGVSHFAANSPTA